MEFSKVKRIVNNIGGGQFHSMVWEREIPVKKSAGNAVVKKRTTASGIRFGVNYDAMKAVNEKREKGELPTENQGLKGREWIVPNLYLRSIKSGKTMLRVSLSKSSKMVTQWYLNGKEVKKEDLSAILYAKDMNANHVEMDCFDVTTDNIIAIM